MWENLKKDKSECGRRGGASSMANLSFVPSQLLRIFIPVEREMTRNPVLKMSWKWCEGSQRHMECMWTRSCPVDLEKRWTQHYGLLPGHVSVSAGDAQDGLSTCCLAPYALQVLTCPHRVHGFVHSPELLSSSTFFSLPWRYSAADSSAVEVQAEHKLSGSLGILKKKGNFFILEMKNVMSAMSIHCMSPEMASSVC